jgi:C4-dicarboxylate-specific signal transduction histidine kinase
LPQFEVQDNKVVVRRSQEAINIKPIDSLRKDQPDLIHTSARYMRHSLSVMSLKGSARRQKVISNSLNKHALDKLPQMRKRFNEETMSVFTKQSKQKLILEKVKQREIKSSQTPKNISNRYDKSEIEMKVEGPVIKETIAKERIDDIKSEILSQAQSHKEIHK